jgi:phage terminase small subunit
LASDGSWRCFEDLPLLAQSGLQLGDARYRGTSGIDAFRARAPLRQRHQGGYGRPDWMNSEAQHRFEEQSRKLLKQSDLEWIDWANIRDGVVRSVTLTKGHE